MILGLRPSSSANLSASSLAFLNDSLSDDSEEYTPEILRITALYLPKTFSNANDISPSVARFRAASMERANKLPSPLIADCDKASNAF